MPINFPTASYTGEIYTSDLGDRWRWNGAAWDNINLQFSGNYQAPWVIFNRSDVPAYYNSLTSAIAAAKKGQTIYLCCDYSEILTISNSNPITLKSDVKINLNGNRYVVSLNVNSSGSILFLAPKLNRVGTNSVEKTNYSIVNGTIHVTGNPSGFRGLHLQGGDGDTTFDFTDLIFYMETPNSYTCYLDGTSTESTAKIKFSGGSFYNFASSGYGLFINNGRNDWAYGETDSCACHVKDCFGWSNTKQGIIWTGIENVTNAPLNTFDYLIITYTYDNQIINGNNRDLDSATVLANTGTVEDNKPVGCGQTEAWSGNGSEPYATPTKTTPIGQCYLYQPGDDVGNGQGESILVNFKNLADAGISVNNNVRVDLYAGWCKAPVPAVASVQITTYIGGTLTTNLQRITSSGTVVQSFERTNIPIVVACCGASLASKTYIGSIYYDLSTGEASVDFN